MVVVPEVEARDSRLLFNKRLPPSCDDNLCGFLPFPPSEGIDNDEGGDEDKGIAVVDDVIEAADVCVLSTTFDDTDAPEVKAVAAVCCSTTVPPPKRFFSSFILTLHEPPVESLVMVTELPAELPPVGPDEDEAAKPPVIDVTTEDDNAEFGGKLNFVAAESLLVLTGEMVTPSLLAQLLPGVVGGD